MRSRRRTLIAHIRNGTGAIIDHVADVGGYPTYAPGTAPTDSDNDGIPNAWETANGLNPNSAADASLTSPNGYTWIEVYINSLLGGSTPPPPPPPTLPYSENFESGTAASWTPAGGTWSVVTDGTQVYRQTVTTGDAISTLGSGWGDQVVQARMKVLSFNGTNRHASVYARYLDANNHYYIALRNSNVIELKKKVGGTVTTLQSVAFTVAANTWYTVKLSVIGNSLNGYVDGVLKVSATDNALAAGGAALGMFNASAQFDDISITSTVPPTILLQEDFEDNVANNFTPSGGTWAIATDGTKVYRQSSTTVADAWSVHATSWTNQILEVAVKPISYNGANRHVSVYARWTDTNNHYYFALRNSNVIELKKKVGGTVTTLGSAAFTPVAGTWYAVKLEVVGTNLKAYIDGTLKLSATDSSLASGRIALGTYGASMSFGDVLVTAP